MHKATARIDSVLSHSPIGRGSVRGNGKKLKLTTVFIGDPLRFSGVCGVLFSLLMGPLALLLGRAQVALALGQAPAEIVHGGLAVGRRYARGVPDPTAKLKRNKRNRPGGEDHAKREGNDDDVRARHASEER